jgi:hypothetical protein
MYEFRRFGCLIKHDGLPLYAGSRLISTYSIVWWWPANWLLVLAVLPTAIVQAVKADWGCGER